jgi:hypothetical protein
MSRPTFGRHEVECSRPSNPVSRPPRAALGSLASATPGPGAQCVTSVRGRQEGASPLRKSWKEGRAGSRDALAPKFQVGHATGKLGNCSEMLSDDLKLDAVRRAGLAFCTTLPLRQS